jgi:O-antigen/teichoic acid export membrane protein
MTSLKKLAIRGTIWTFFGYGLTQSLRLVNNLILTRLLAPEIFGLMSLVNTFRWGLELFTDVGIAQNIVQSDRGEEHEFLDTAWTIQTIRGLLIWIATCALAYPLALLYDEPQIWQVLPIISLANFLTSFQTVRVYVLNRNLALRKKTLFEISEKIFALAVMITYALISPTIWALVAGGIAGSLFKMVASYFLCPGPLHRFFLEAKSRIEIASFGRWIFLGSIFTFLAEQSDRLILGKLVPLEILGIYTVAWTLASLPKQIMTQLSSKVIFPIVSKQSHLPRNQLRRKILKQRFRLLLSLFAIFIALICFGDWIIEFLYDDRYIQAGWMLSILTLGGWFSMLYYTASPCLLGIGKPLYNARGKGIRLVVVAISLIGGFQIAGVFGAIVAIAFSDLIAYIYICYGLQKESLSVFRQDIAMTLSLAAVLTVVLLARLLLGYGHPLSALSVF